jgi:hypothetical protein
MAEHILRVVLSVSKLTVDQASILFALLSWQIVLVYFMCEVWRRCDF